jgi:hypothetical protein
MSIIDLPIARAHKREWSNAFEAGFWIVEAAIFAEISARSFTCTGTIDGQCRCDRDDRDVENPE